jgi:hypothetical protein
VDDTPLKLNGKQSIITPDGYHIPLSIHQGLPWMDMSAPTPLDMRSYPHVLFTSDMPWNPSDYDSKQNTQDLDPSDLDLNPAYHADTLNNFGEITNYHINYHHVQPKQLDFIRLQPNFGFIPVDRIKHTLQHTTQYARLDNRFPLRKHYKTRFPAANVS